MGNLATTDEVDIPNPGLAGWMSGSKGGPQLYSSREECHDLMWPSECEPTFKVFLRMALIQNQTPAQHYCTGVQFPIYTLWKVHPDHSQYVKHKGLVIL